MNFQNYFVYYLSFVHKYNMTVYLCVQHSGIKLQIWEAPLFTSKAKINIFSNGGLPGLRVDLRSEEKISKSFR